MRNNILFVITIAFISLAIGQAEEPETTLLRDEMVRLRVSEESIIMDPVKSMATMSHEAAQAMQTLLAKAGDSDDTLNGEDVRTISMAIRLTASRKRPADIPTFERLLESSHRNVRADAAQALAAFGGEGARSSLEKATMSRMTQMRDPDLYANLEVIDFVRCTLLATAPENGEASLARLLARLKQVFEDDEEKAKEGAKIFYKIAAEVDMARGNKSDSLVGVEQARETGRTVTPEAAQATKTNVSTQALTHTQIVFAAALLVLLGVGFFIWRRR